VKKTKSRHNAPWTQSELKQMRALAKKGMPARIASRILGRTIGAIKYKAMTERIRFHAIEQPVGVQKRLALQRKRSRRRTAGVA
jgi:hypothetical protein